MIVTHDSTNLTTGLHYCCGVRLTIFETCILQTGVLYQDGLPAVLTLQGWPEGLLNRAYVDHKAPMHIHLIHGGRPPT